MRVKIITLLLLVTSISILSAQQQSDEIVLTKALMLKLATASRPAQYTDPVEESIVHGTWAPPKENDAVAIGDVSAVWEAVQADSNGWFEMYSEQFRGLYLYIAVESQEDKISLLKGMGYDFVYVNSEPRTGNIYGWTDEISDWGPNFNYSILPIQLNSGNNHFLFSGSRAGQMKVRLQQPETAVVFNTKDLTVPDLIIGEAVDTWGAVTIINASRQPMKNYVLQSLIGEGEPVQTAGGIIQPMSVRKIPFRLQGTAPTATGKVDVQLKLSMDGAKKAATVIQLNQVEPLTTHKRTFISNIDGSVQYYANNPAQDTNPATPKALVLSVHGAGVEALNQARSYYGKTWAHIVSPTNRRPYGFNWEDWGRIDALETLADVQSKLNIDQSRIYLTGHSMGGHGSWHLGVIYPDQFAAIGPSAGYASLHSYRRRGSSTEETPVEKMLSRASLPGKTTELEQNFRQLGIYILHGGDDDNVPPEEARVMAERLSKFHKDYIYFEQPGRGHWWDISDEHGSDCVDWMPMFDFFARHARPGEERIRHIDFTTANPGVSAKNNWLSIEAQIEQLKLSHVDIRFDPGINRFTGTTANVARISFFLNEISQQDSVNIELDGQNLGTVPVQKTDRRVWLSREKDRWILAGLPSADLKGPHRYGTFKDAVRNRVLFVYGTKGDEQENSWAFNKARYDAEYFWYQGNGSIEVIADSEFDPSKEPNRNVILYGNAKTNSAWKPLLAKCPVQVNNGLVKVGKKSLQGDNFAAVFIRPRPGSDIASVGVVSGTGIVGMKLTERVPYWSRMMSLPDLVVANSSILSERDKGVEVAGFFGLDWRIESGEFVWSSDKKR